MQPLEVESQSKLVDEEVKTTNSKVGTEPLIAIHDETTKIVARQPKG